jgi:hypothetical protein
MRGTIVSGTLLELHGAGVRDCRSGKSAREQSTDEAG